MPILICMFFTFNSSGVSHSDGSCVLGRIHSDVSSNIPKKVYHIVTDNFVNLLHISYAWLYKTECWGRKFHAFSFNSHRNCKIFMTYFNFIFDTICVPYIFRKSIFGWNCYHDTPLCDTPLLEDTPLCDTPDELIDLDLWNAFCEVSPWGSFLLPPQRQKKVCTSGDEAIMKIHKKIFSCIPINVTLFVISPNLQRIWSWNFGFAIRKIWAFIDIKQYTTSGWALGDENVIGIRAFNCK